MKNVPFKSFISFRSMRLESNRRSALSSSRTKKMTIFNGKIAKKQAVCRYVSEKGHFEEQELRLTSTASSLNASKLHQSRSMFSPYKTNFWRDEPWSKRLSAISANGWLWKHSSATEKCLRTSLTEPSSHARVTGSYGVRISVLKSMFSGYTS